jgi:hypothetical protein
VKINFHKNEIYYLGESLERKQVFEETRSLAMKYLGVSINEK